MASSEPAGVGGNVDEEMLSLHERLLEVADINFFKENAFRVTGLQIDASTREISKHGDRLRMLEELGGGTTGINNVFSPTAAPSGDDIRAALQRLKNPVHRLVDEIFWFWPEISCETDPAIRALVQGQHRQAMAKWMEKEKISEDPIIAMHNIAVAYHLLALDKECQQMESIGQAQNDTDVDTYWGSAHRRWGDILGRELFYRKVESRIDRIDDPSLPANFQSKMQGSIRMALCKIHALLTIGFAQKGMIERARFHTELLAKLDADTGAGARAAALVVDPIKSRLRQHIQSAKKVGTDTPLKGATAATQLMTQADKEIFLMSLLLAESSMESVEIADEIAITCNRLLVQYNEKADDDHTCLSVYRKAVRFAKSSSSKQQIQKNISVTCSNIVYGKLAPSLKKLNELSDSGLHPSSQYISFRDTIAPVLDKLDVGDDAEIQEQAKIMFDRFADGARDISICAWNKYQDLDTAISANRLALKYAKSEKMVRLLNEDHEAVTRIVNRKKQENKETLFKFVGVAAVLTIIVFVFSNASSSTPNRSSPSVVNTYTPPPAPEPVTQSYSTSTNGQYRIPRQYTAELARDERELEAQRTVSQYYQAQVTSLRAELEREGRYLDNTNQYSINQYNEKVDKYNSLRATGSIEIDKLNALVDAYNAKLRRYGH